MGFKKATPTKVRLKASFYGPPGSGKTFTSLLFAEALAAERGGRIAFVDTENGTKAYAMHIEKRPVHPDPFDFDVLHTRSLAATLEAVQGLKPDEHSVVVLDSMSHLWDAAREAWEEKNPGAKDIPLRAWAAIKKPYKDLMKWVVSSPFDVFIIGRQKHVFEEEDGKLRSVGVAMRAEGETQFEPDLCFRMYLEGERGEEAIPMLLCEKDRYGVLAGRRYSKPNGDTLRPLFPYLGTDAIPEENEEERLAADGDLMAQQDEKAAKKAQKSTTLFEEFQPRLRETTTAEELAAIAADLKKQKRYMTEGHLGALRVIYEARRQEIVNKSMPEV